MLGTPPNTSLETMRGDVANMHGTLIGCAGASAAGWTDGRPAPMLVVARPEGEEMARSRRSAAYRTIISVS